MVPEKFSRASLTAFLRVLVAMAGGLPCAGSAGAEVLFEQPGGYECVATEDFGSGLAAFRLKTTATGRATGQLRLPGRVLTIRGAFGEDFRFSQTFPASRNFAGATLDLIMSVSELSVSGFFGINDGPTYRVDAWFTKSGSGAEPVPERGYYTAYTAESTFSIAPAIFGVTVSHSGAARIVGRVPGSGPASTAARIVAGGDLPMFIPLDRSISFLGGTASISLGEILGGNLTWVTPLVENVPLNDSAALIGRRYTPPSRGARILDDFDATGGAGWASLPANALGDLDESFVTFTWQNSNRAVFDAPNAPRMRVSFQARTGFFRGQFRDTGRRTNQFHGVCVQHPSAGFDVATGYHERWEDTAWPVDLYPEE